MAVFICGVIGIAMFLAFLIFMLIWVPALPLIVIVAVCSALLIWDFVQTMRYGENAPPR